MLRSGRFYLALMAALCAPLQAAALRCARPLLPIERVNVARLAPESSVVGYGTFSSDLPQHSIGAGFPGRSYTFDGVVFGNGYATPVDPGTPVISTSCTRSTWCNGIPIRFVPNRTYLVIFERHHGSGDLSVHAGLCGSSFVRDVGDLNLTDLATCLANGSCTTADLGIMK